MSNINHSIPTSEVIFIVLEICTPRDRKQCHCLTSELVGNIEQFQFARYVVVQVPSIKTFGPFQCSAFDINRAVPVRSGLLHTGYFAQWSQVDDSVLQFPRA